MAEWQRTHTCNEIRELHVGQTVTLNGWVLTTRDNGHQAFIDLRDRYGLTQVVFHKADRRPLRSAAEAEERMVLSITGVVCKRLEGAQEPHRHCHGCSRSRGAGAGVLNQCPPLPFEVSEFDNKLANEDLRLQALPRPASGAHLPHAHPAPPAL